MRSILADMAKARSRVSEAELSQLAQTVRCTVDIGPTEQGKWMGSLRWDRTARPSDIGSSRIGPMFSPSKQDLLNSLATAADQTEPKARRLR